MKSIESQLEWLDDELITQRRKNERWVRQRRISPADATRYVEHLASVRETIRLVGVVKGILESETGEESEFEQNERGDRISGLLMRICQLGPEKVGG